MRFHIARSTFGRRGAEIALDGLTSPELVLLNNEANEVFNYKT